MSADAGQLLLRSDTAGTCPKCANESGLEQGFAKKALDQLSDASAGAIADLRDAERAAVERHAQEISAEQARSARTETESLKKLLKEQGEAQAAALVEVRKLAAQSVAPQIEQMRREIAGPRSTAAGARGQGACLNAAGTDPRSTGDSCGRGEGSRLA